MNRLKRIILPALSFVLSTVTTGCNLFNPDDSNLVARNTLNVNLVKREYFENEKIDLSKLEVKGFIADTNSYTSDVDYTIRWESTGKLIQDGDTITQGEGQYYWIFSAETYHSYRIAISVYSPKSEDVVIDTYPSFQYFTAGNNFSYEGLVVKRKITYASENEDGTTTEQTRIYDINPSECFLSYSNNGQNIPLTNNYVFPEGTKGIYTVTVSVPSFQDANKTKRAGTYKINVNDSASTLSLDDFDESSIVKYQTDDTLTLTITNTKIDSSKQEETNNYISPDNVDNSYGLDYYSEVNDEEKVLCPSKGDVPVLVIPIYYNDTEASKFNTNENLDLIEKCFFGNSNDLYFESLKSYYYKSSYGKLNFYGEVMPAFNPQTKINGLSFVNGALAIRSDSEQNFQRIIRESLSFIENLGYDLRDYDSNADGYIDALWFVSLSALNREYPSGSWPHVNNFKNTTPDISTPTVNMFAWTPVETFMNSFYSRRSNHSGLGQNHLGDAHTIIHETGHLLGLSDYYSTAADQKYVINTNDDEHECGYAPLGGMDMMDQNYLDHNPYSKLLFGWTKPYLVYGNSTITLQPSLYKNQVVIIPCDSFDYSDDSLKNSRGETIFNPYDEYLVIDFFTPESNYSTGDYITDNVNSKSYDVYDTQTITKKGIRIYHVDKRGVIVTDSGEKDSNNRAIMSYSQPEKAFDLLSLESGQKLACPVTNTEYGPTAEKGIANRNGKITFFDNYCDEIRIMTSDNKEFADSRYCIQGNTFSDNTLKANEVIFEAGSTFTVGQYTSQVKVTSYPSSMPTNERRSTLSCFGFTTALLKEFSEDEFQDFYLYISSTASGSSYTKYYSREEYDILSKVYNCYRNEKQLSAVLTEEELNVFNSLAATQDYNRGAFNNGALCSYKIAIS